MTATRTKKPPVPRAGHLKTWPSDRPLPSFKSLDEEDEFWRTHRLDNTGWEEFVYTPTRRSHTHVQRLRLNDREMVQLQAQAQTRGLPLSVTRETRRHIYTARFDDEEWAIIQGLMKQRKASAADVLRALIQTLPVPQPGTKKK